MKAKQFRKLLARYGIEFITSRGKGGHWIAVYGGRQATIPDHGDADFGPVFPKNVCRELGLDPKEAL